MTIPQLKHCGLIEVIERGYRGAGRGFVELTWH